MRVERFELITKLVLSQPPLPIGLHAQNDLNWYSREDSNLQDGRFELPMSAGLHHASKCIADFRLPIANLLSYPRVSAESMSIGNWQLKIGKAYLVPAEGFEPSLSSS